MIVKEDYKGHFIRTYSDAGFRIMQTETGIIYDEAIDKTDKEYTETDEKRDDWTPSGNSEAAELLSIITGEGGV